MPKEVKELLVENVPSERQEFPDFKFLLAIIKENKITTADKLQAYLQKSISSLEKKLEVKKRGNSTINRQRVKLAKNLDGFKLCQRLANEYLG
jgi:hypothetical protein